MTAAEVCWTPYGTGEDGLPRFSYFRGCIHFLDITEVYMPERVLRQFGIQQGIPREPLKAAVCILSSSQKGYKKTYGDTDDFWIDWIDYGVAAYDPVLRLGPSVTAAGPVTAYYMDWFRARSHIRISNPIHDVGVEMPAQPSLAQSLPDFQRYATSPAYR